MKTALNNSEKRAGLFRAIAPVVAQEQDDRFRQIIREELSQMHPPKPVQPSVKSKTAALIEYPFPLALIDGFYDQLQKTAQLTLSSVAPKPTISNAATRLPRNTLTPSTAMNAKPPSYSQVNPASSPGPAQTAQPLLSPPPVRG